MNDSIKDRLEIIKTVSSAVSAFGIVCAALGLVLQYKVWTTYHQRARCDRAVTLTSELTKALGPATRAAEKIDSTLGKPQVESLFKGESFSIPASNKDLLSAALGRANLEGTTDNTAATHTYTLTPSESFSLRWQIVAYLNAIEVICLAWEEDVAERRIIEKELKGLYMRGEGFTFCEHYRRDTSGEIHYPSLYKVIAKLEKIDTSTTTIAPHP